MLCHKTFRKRVLDGFRRVAFYDFRQEFGGVAGPFRRRLFPETIRAFGWEMDVFHDRRSRARPFVPAPFTFLRFRLCKCLVNPIFSVYGAYWHKIRCAPHSRGIAAVTGAGGRASLRGTLFPAFCPTGRAGTGVIGRDASAPGGGLQGAACAEPVRGPARRPQGHNM